MKFPITLEFIRRLLMTDDDLAGGRQESLTTISKGASLFLIGKIISRVLGFATNVILTRYLGAGLYGIYAYLDVIYSLSIALTQLGGDKSVMRFLPEYENNPRKQSAMLTLAYGTSIIISTVVALAIYVSAPLISEYTLNEPLFVDVLRITAVVILFNTLSQVTYSIFKSIERMDYNVALSSIANPLLRLVFIGGAVLLGYSLIGAAAGIVVSAGLTLLIGFVVLLRRTNFGSVSRPTQTDAKEYYNFSIPLTFTELGSFFYNRTDILMVGFFLSGSAVGVYNVAFLLSRLLALPVQAFNQLFPPIASKLYHNSDYDELDSVYTTVTRLVFTVTLFPAIATIVYAPDLLRIFGKDFVQGQVVLILFAVAQLANALVGPSGFLLMMSDHQYLTMFNQVGSGIINAVANYILIINFGFVGAALATASVVAIVNILRVIEVLYFESLLPYNLSYLKPIVAGMVSGLVMYGISIAFDQYFLSIFIGGSIGAVVFFFILYLLGIDEEDIRLVRSLID